MAQHRVLAREARVRYHGRTTTRGFKSNWEVSAAFVTSRANGYSGADMYWNCSRNLVKGSFKCGDENLI